MQSILFASETDTPPAIVFWENVPGVLSTKDNAFGCFLGALAGEDCELKPPGKRWTDAGCVFGPQRAIAWRVLDAQYFGLAQRRRRVFVVASARDGFDPAAVLFEFDGVRRDTPPRREAREVAPTTPARSSGGGGLGTDFDCDGGLITRAVSLRGREGGGTAELGDDVQNCLRASSGGGDKPHVLIHADPIARCLTTGEAKRQDWETCNFVAHTLRGEGFDASEDGTGRGTPLVPHVVGALACNTGPNGHDAGNFACNQAVDAGHVLPVAAAFHPTQDPISSSDGSTHALGCGSSGGQASVAVALACMGVQPMAVRRLTVVECERLMGFPDGYTAIPWRGKPADQCPDGPRYRSLGNSWAVPVARWIGERINAVEYMKGRK